MRISSKFFILFLCVHFCPLSCGEKQSELKGLNLIIARGHEIESVNREAEVIYDPGSQCNFIGLTYSNDPKIIIASLNTRLFEGSFKMVSISLKGGLIKTIYESEGDCILPSSSSDGKIAFIETKLSEENPANRIIIIKGGDAVMTIHDANILATKLSWYPGGDKLAYGCQNETIKIYDIKEKRVVEELKGSDPCVSVAGDKIAFIRELEPSRGRTRNAVFIMEGNKKEMEIYIEGKIALTLDEWINNDQDILLRTGGSTWYGMEFFDIDIISIIDRKRTLLFGSGCPISGVLLPKVTLLDSTPATDG